MTFSIKTMKVADIPAVQKLFNETITKLCANRPPEERRHLKEDNGPEQIKERLKDKNSVYLVGRKDKKAIGYVFGWNLDGVGHIHWFYVTEDSKGMGYERKLQEKALSEFKKMRCYESRAFVYPEDRETCDLLESLGFLRKASLEEEFLGVGLVLFIKQLAKLPKIVQKKLILTGEAGQGIKLMAHALANILAKLGKEVSVNILYDATVRSGDITAELVFSDERIDVPFFNRADICLQLSKPVRRKFNADKQIIDRSIAEDLEYTGAKDVHPFKQDAIEKFGSPIFINMIALGRVLNYIGIPIDQVDFRTSLPARFLEENVRAIKYGYTYQD